MNLIHWELVGFHSANLAVKLHIRLKSEFSLVFGFLKAASKLRLMNYRRKVLSSQLLL